LPLWKAINDHAHTAILYINSVSLSICPGRYILNPCEQGVVFVFNVPSWTCTRKNCPSVKVLKPISLLIKLSPRTRRPKNYSGPQILTSYFYFYVHFRATTAVVDGGGIFGIWMVGEEIWVRLFWVKGLGRSSIFIFFMEGGRGWGWGSRSLNRWKWIGVGNVKDRVGGIDGMHYAPGSH
jgi:hypothetical protein